MTVSRKSSWLLACALLVPAARAFPREPALRRFEFTEAHMGTRFRIVVCAPHRETALGASRAAFSRVQELDHIMSDYQPDSELMALGRAAGGPPVEISDDLFRVLLKAQQLASESEGAFDVTIGPVVRLWREARWSRQMPDAAQLARARALVGLDKLHIDPATHTAQLTVPGMLLDLGGIAKGYAADEALKILKQRGLRRALVAAGGDIAVGAPPPGKEGWRIGIAPLESLDNTPSRFLWLRDAGVSTSGDAEQFVEIDGVRYSHIVDPRTGLGLTGHSSVTVVAPDATTSDSLATAVSVLGPERGLRLVRSTPGTSARIERMTAKGRARFEWRFPPIVARAGQ